MRRKPAASMLRTVRAHARQRGNECTLTVEQLREMLAPMRCSVSGIELTWSDEHHHPWTPSVDRIDNSKGYVDGNVRVVCWLFNRAKHVGTDADVFKLARALADREHSR